MAQITAAIVKELRERTGAAFTIAVKLNSADFQKGGFNFSDSTRVAQWLSEGVATCGLLMTILLGVRYRQQAVPDLEAYLHHTDAGQDLDAITDRVAELKREV